MNTCIEGSNPSFSAGGVAERSNAAVSKTVIRRKADRGFKSLPLRWESRIPLRCAGFGVSGWGEIIDRRHTGQRSQIVALPPRPRDDGRADPLRLGGVYPPAFTIVETVERREVFVLQLREFRVRSPFGPPCARV